MGCGCITTTEKVNEPGKKGSNLPPLKIKREVELNKTPEKKITEADDISSIRSSDIFTPIV